MERNVDWQEGFLRNGWSDVCFVMQEEELDSLRESIETVDQNRPPLKVINGYSILDHLGTGAFGSVFKVRTSEQCQVIDI